MGPSPRPAQGPERATTILDMPCDAALDNKDTGRYADTTDRPDLTDAHMDANKDTEVVVEVLDSS